MDRIIIKHDLMPGDLIVLTASIRDLSLAYPNKYAIIPMTAYRELWQGNPYIVYERLTPQIIDSTPQFDVNFGHYISHANENKMHFIDAMNKSLSDKLGIIIPVTKYKGDLYLSNEELNCENLPKKPYWVMMAGGKSDFPVKWYPYWQEVVNGLPEVRFVQCGKIGAGDGANHNHKPLRGVINKLNQTSLRELITLIYHSQGVVGGVTFALHVAACFDKPAIMISGGRECLNWLYYRNQIIMHTIGELDCCKSGGCYKQWAHHMEGYHGDETKCLNV